MSRILSTGRGVCLSACWDTTHTHTHTPWTRQAPPPPRTRQAPSRDHPPPQEQAGTPGAEHAERYQWQIQDFPKEGAPTLQEGRQHTILPNFPKNCMKLKEFGPPGGGHASKILLCRSATGYGQRAGGMHPTGMQSCLRIDLLANFFPKTSS